MASKAYKGINYDTDTDYMALSKGTTNPDLLSTYGNQRAAKIYGEGMSQYYNTVPQNLQYLQGLSDISKVPTEAPPPITQNQPGQPTQPQANTQGITPASTNKSNGYDEKYLKTMESFTNYMQGMIDKLQSPLTPYDSKKDESFQAAQTVIGDNVYRDMARRGIADSSITPQQSYQLSMQALPQFAQQYYDRENQNKLMQLQAYGLLQNQGVNEFNVMDTNRKFDYGKIQDAEQNAIQKGQMLGIYKTPQQEQWEIEIQNNPDMYSEYANNYQAEINKTQSGTKKWYQLNYLRDNKIDSGNLGYSKSQLGQKTLDRQELDYEQQRDFTTDTGIRFNNQEQFIAYNTTPPEQLQAIINKYANQPGGIQTYINNLNPNSAEFTRAQMARNMYLNQNPDLQKYGYSQYGTKTQQGKMNESQIISNELKNSLDRVYLKYADTKEGLIIEQLKTAIESGNLENKYKEISNKYAGTQIMKDIDNTIANTYATYANVDLQNRSLDADTNYKNQSLAIDWEQLGMQKDAANTSYIDTKEVASKTKTYSNFIRENYTGGVNKNGAEVSKGSFGDEANKKAAAKYIGKIGNSGDVYDYLSAIELAKQYGLDLAKYGVTLKKK